VDFPELEELTHQFLSGIQKDVSIKPEASKKLGSFVGVKTCQKCHSYETNMWEITDHAKAFWTIYFEQFQFYPQCVSCHSTGFQKPGGHQLGIAPLAEMSAVQCESCHGPGSLHVENGGGSYPSKVTQEGCLVCHNGEWATSRLDLIGRWDELAHNRKVLKKLRNEVQSLEWAHLLLAQQEMDRGASFPLPTERRRRFKRAQASLNEVIKNKEAVDQEKLFGASFRLGLLFSGIYDFKDARLWFEHANGIKSTREGELENARILGRTGKKEGIKKLKKIIEDNPGDATAIAYLAEVIRSTEEDLDGAIQLLNQAIKIDVNNFYANFMMVDLLMEKNDYQSTPQIIQHFKRAQKFINQQGKDRIFGLSRKMKYLKELLGINGQEK